MILFFIVNIEGTYSLLVTGKMLGTIFLGVV